MKKLLVCLAVLLLGIGIVAGSGTQAKAAKNPKVTYFGAGEDEKINLGNKYVWYEKDKGLVVSDSEGGVETILVTSPGENKFMNIGMCVDQDIYYGIGERNYNATNITNMKIYKVNINDGSITYIKKMKHAMSIVFYYGGKLYIDCYDKNSDNWDTYHTYELNTKTKKVKKIFNATMTGKIYDNAYMFGYFGGGDFTPVETKLQYYNAKINKKYTISKSCGSYEKIGNRIYYAEYAYLSSNGGADKYKITIYSCNLKGKAKKKHAQFEGLYVSKFTTDYVIYSVSNYKNGDYITKYYKYTFKTGKKKKVKEPKSEWKKYN